MLRISKRSKYLSNSEPRKNKGKRARPAYPMGSPGYSQGPRAWGGPAPPNGLKKTEKESKDRKNREKGKKKKKKWEKRREKEIKKRQRKNRF